jgi:hypothetical protein
MPANVTFLAEAIALRALEELGMCAPGPLFLEPRNHGWVLPHVHGSPY